MAMQLALGCMINRGGVMSNDVCGYVYSLLSQEVMGALNDYIESSEIGITKIIKEQLYNFPDELLPMESSYIFLIGDRPDYPNATYLIDYIDYSSEADIGFPVHAKARLDILLNALSDIFIITNARKMVVAITDCNQIQTIKKIKIAELYDVIHADFEEYQAPPDTLYEISA
jgi:hypothetical protein